jgi:hypothetical protein
MACRPEIVRTHFQRCCSVTESFKIISFLHWYFNPFQIGGEVGLPSGRFRTAPDYQLDCQSI